MRTRETIITISNIVMVNIGPDGKVLPHGMQGFIYPLYIL